jgi:8-oxo-dGTP diphosphatase
MTLPRVGCGAAILVDGRILLVRRTGAPEAGRWGLPGGKVDPFETVAAATAREVAEELGVAIEAGGHRQLVGRRSRRAGATGPTRQPRPR